jgi:hypothetical protein
MWPAVPSDDGYYGARAMDRAAKTILFTEWCGQIENGHLTERGLMLIRHRLTTNEFLPDALRDHMRLVVDDALAAMLGMISPADLPGHLAAVPDDPGALE